MGANDKRRAIGKRRYNWLAGETRLWLARGIMSPDQAGNVLDLDDRTGGFGAARASFELTGLAVLMAGVALALLVGYNWNGLARGAKVILVLGAVLAAFAGSAAAHARASDLGGPDPGVCRRAGLRERNLAPARLVAALMGGFSLLALALGAVGFCGVTAYAVTRRTHEMGLKMALGACRADLQRLFGVQGPKLVLGGLAIGLPATLALSPLTASLLHGVGPNDPLTLAGASALLLVVVGGAAYLPARRATRTDPMTALRVE